MFDNYNFPGVIECNCNNSTESEVGVNTRLLRNLKQQIYGIEAKYLMPFTIYFHVEDPQSWPLASFISEAEVEFNVIIPGTDKKVITKTFKGAEVFLTESSDLKIELTDTDISVLKQETYKMQLEARTSTKFYRFFDVGDGLLVIR
jgi:hypothetical protein